MDHVHRLTSRPMRAQELAIQWVSSDETFESRVPLAPGCSGKQIIFFFDRADQLQTQWHAVRSFAGRDSDRRRTHQCPDRAKARVAGILERCGRFALGRRRNDR